MSTSLYWDDFERRTIETVNAIKVGLNPPIRRVAIFITNQCNFACKYCNHERAVQTLSEAKFTDIIEKYAKDSIIHITGGEPSVVPWLYPFLRENGDKYRFNLNTNAFIKPPYEYVKRLKISLDSHDAAYWNKLVGRNAFDTVSKHIKEACDHTTVSLTYTLTRQNYMDAIAFAKYANKEFPNLYAVFFSVYKGTNPEFALNGEDGETFFNVILPELEQYLGKESLALVRETIDEKRRLIQGIRFPQNESQGICYLSMSELVISPSGEEFTCSHLYRDNIFKTVPTKHDKCKYGCNRRLVQFNEKVSELLNVNS